jgi:hypothetical protein
VAISEVPVNSLSDHLAEIGCQSEIALLMQLLVL